MSEVLRLRQSGLGWRTLDAEVVAAYGIEPAAAERDVEDFIAEARRQQLLETVNV